MTTAPPTPPAPDPAFEPALEAGRAALAAGAWDDALAAFQAALAVREDPAALEGLGLAAWWSDRTAMVFDSRERAYRLYRERGDTRAAARVAVWLAWDYSAFRGEGAVARGWLGLARQLLEGDHLSLEYAWLSAREGVVVLYEEGDPEGARQHASAAIAAAQAVGSRDYELLGVAVDALAQVSQGQIAEGMRKLDRVSAALIAGEIVEPIAIGLSGCYLITACERVRDYDRAAQWCERIKAFCLKTGLRPLFAVCRTHYAAVCLWKGAWDEAERELVSAVGELAAARPGMTADGSVWLGELRRRQGRLDEAQQLFDETEGHPMSTVGRAALALDRGDAVSAGDLAERYLRGLNAHNRTERVTALEIVVRARAAAGRVDEARAAADELDVIAREAGTVPLRGAARVCQGLLASIGGDLDDARRAYEDAVDHFHRSGAAYEGARARVELASVLGQAGRVDAAVQELRRAIEQFTPMAAQPDMARAEQQLASMLEPSGAPGSARRAAAGTIAAAGAAAVATGAAAIGAEPSVLSRRECDVLRLVAKGLSNQRVAEQLFISEHTVHRHVANILTKLDVPSRSAAVAQAARLGLLES